MDHLSHQDQQTNTSGALKVAMDGLFNGADGDRPDARDVMILVTDGKPNPPINPNKITYNLREVVREIKSKGK